jgi:hypothetical protein
VTRPVCSSCPSASRTCRRNSEFSRESVDRQRFTRRDAGVQQNSRSFWRRPPSANTCPYPEGAPPNQCLQLAQPEFDRIEPGRPAPVGAQIVGQLVAVTRIGLRTGGAPPGGEPQRTLSGVRARQGDRPGAADRPPARWSVRSPPATHWARRDAAAWSSTRIRCAGMPTDQLRVHSRRAP